MPEAIEQNDHFADDELEIKRSKLMPRIYTLSQAPFISCLVEEQDGLDLALRRADDDSDGDQNGPDLEGHILQSLNCDLPTRERAHIDWKNYEFYFSEFDPPDHEEPLCNNWSVFLSGHPTTLSRYTDRRIRANAKQAWDMLAGILLSQVPASRCAIFAKRNSPFTQHYEHIAPDIWRYFTVVDWEKGTAKSPNGEFLFSIMVAFEAFECVLPLLNEVKSQIDHERDQVIDETDNLKNELDEIINLNRGRPILKKLIGFFYRTYPDILPSDVLDRQKMLAIAEFMNVDEFNRVTSNRAKDQYVRMRNLERDITTRNKEEYYDKLRAFLTENN